ncbi:MAG TPA: presqualene diphosphate synthase HpnD [Methylomirabilota bacterium]|nr:presqualene diphosphate synthase HpnD [Methylomirabilota bacterium]
MQESRNITQKSASNLALAFVLLPKAKRDGMSALYAFCREVDDVADDESVPLEERRARLAAWREDVRRACQRAAGLSTAGTAGTLAEPQFAVNRELQTIIREHPGLTFELFDDLIRGVEMDLDIKRYDTHAALEHYCYRVASVVGLLSIEIFGYSNPRTREYAIHLGKALQLTNIVRDVKADAERGRIYFPLEELSRFRVSEAEILDGNYTPRFRELAASIAGRARHFYKLARHTLPPEDRRAMAAAELMGSVYWRLLQKLEARQFDVFGKPTRVSKGQKILLILRTWLRIASGRIVPNYGTP